MSDYFSSWRDRGFTCARCSWTATAEEASHELFAELFEVNWPQCDARLDLVLYPTDESKRVYDLHGRVLRPRPGKDLPSQEYALWHSQEVFRGTTLAS